MSIFLSNNAMIVSVKVESQTVNIGICWITNIRVTLHHTLFYGWLKFATLTSTSRRKYTSTRLRGQCVSCSPKALPLRRKLPRCRRFRSCWLRKPRKKRIWARRFVRIVNYISWILNWNFSPLDSFLISWRTGMTMVLMKVNQVSRKKSSEVEQRRFVMINKKLWFNVSGLQD